MDSISQLEQNIKKMKEDLNSKFVSNQNMTKVIVIGITGSGKSSLVNVMINNNINIAKGSGNIIELIGPGISNGQSCTREPGVFIDSASNIAYLDCPGFEDTYGDYQEIVNAIIIDYLFTMSPSSKFKILLVISDSEFQAIRGQGIKSNIERMTKMFPNKEQLQKCLGIIITKGKSKLTNSDYIELLDDCPDEIRDWCTFFKNNPDRFFIFPKAKRENVGQKYDFKDHEHLNSFLKINQVSNISHNIAFSESATQYLKNIGIEISKKVENIIHNLFAKMNDSYRYITSSSQLNSWINWMNQLKNRRLNSINELKSFIQNYIPSSYQYNCYFSSLDEMQSINEFIVKVLKHDYTGSTLCEKVRSNADSAEQETSYLYNKIKEQEELERRRIEQQRRLEEQRRIENEERRREQERLRIIEEQRRRQEEEQRRRERMRREEEERERRRKQLEWEIEQERRRQAEQKRKQEEQRRKLEQMRREEEERERRRKQLEWEIEQERRRRAEQERRIREMESDDSCLLI